MSERQEKKKRYNLRLMWIADFDKWLNREPPMWRVFAWRRWKRERPVLHNRGGRGGIEID